MADEKRFWSGGRRRFVARTLSTVGLVVIGGLVTSEVLTKFPVALKWSIAAVAVVAIVAAIVVWSDDGDDEKGDA